MDDYKDLAVERPHDDPEPLVEFEEACIDRLDELVRLSQMLVALLEAVHGVTVVARTEQKES